MKVWCVEDDESIRDIEVYTLNSTDFEARGFADGAAFREALNLEKPDLVILDIMLPGEDGVELLRALRADPDTCRIPVIMATAKGMEYDKIRSLDMGADDYLVKPFGMMEMVSRVRAVLRRCLPGDVQHLLKTGGLVMNLDEYTVTIDDERIHLTLKEFELLRLFLSHPGIVFTRDRLFNDIWGDDYVGETRTVDMHIRTLRAKLGEYGRLIETVRGVGYRLEVNGNGKENI
ncbi:MAG: response regulator transcription factor [Clostridium sp.]|nr:response regulator transcription factor [Acetatifactor muris]MCM1526956.1 response regulator transcription factor [Bacteroides sp.]MCM1563119.1 response regulator transcription factor [Clostridium sp.]